MPTDMNEQMMAWMDSKRQANQYTRGDYKLMFLAVKSDVIKARNAGYSFITIWEYLHELGRIPFRYETFLRYVRRYITQNPRGWPLDSQEEH